MLNKSLFLSPLQSPARGEASDKLSREVDWPSFSSGKSLSLINACLCEWEKREQGLMQEGTGRRGPDRAGGFHGLRSAGAFDDVRQPDHAG